MTRTEWLALRKLLAQAVTHFAALEGKESEDVQTLVSALDVVDDLGLIEWAHQGKQRA